MNKLPFKHRRKTPVSAFGTGFEAALHDFTAAFLKSAAFKHASSKGEEREIPVQDFFMKHLPAAFGVEKGEAVDIFGHRGPQLDVMIFNKFRNFAFYDGRSKILPAEALLASLEVKTLLTSSEIRASFQAASRLYKLKPFKRRLAVRRSREEIAAGSARYFHCIFAYNSDLSQNGWVESEFVRMIDVARQLSLPTSLIDRIYVANRGLINLPEEKASVEGPTQGTALMLFYMHILNFLSRENQRRKPVPYIEYAGRMTGGWQSLSHLNTQNS